MKALLDNRPDKGFYAIEGEPGWDHYFTYGALLCLCLIEGNKAYALAEKTPIRFGRALWAGHCAMMDHLFNVRWEELL